MTDNALYRITKLEEENKKQKELNNSLYKSLEKVGKINAEKQLKNEELKTQVDILREENEQLKKNAIVWHKVTCFDDPDENSFITANNPAEEGKDYLVLLKNKHIVISALAYDDDGYFFDDFDWEDIEAWAELPEV